MNDDFETQPQESPPFQIGFSEGAVADPSFAAGSEPDLTPEEPKRGFTVFSWFIIFCCVMMIVVFVGLAQFAQPTMPFSKAELLQPILMGKYVVGVKSLDLLPGNDLNSVIEETMNSGPLEQRYCYAIMVNELSGPESALESLRQIAKDAKRSGVTPDQKQTRLNNVLQTLFEQYQRDSWQAGAVSDEDREFIKDELSWFGQLVLAPKQKLPDTERQSLVSRARVTIFCLFGMAGVLLILLLLGLVGLVLYLIFFLKGSLKSRVSDRSMNGPIYAETFAIWMVLFIVGSFVSQLPIFMRLNLIGLPLVMSMMALFWPLLRGIPFSEFRDDVGWTFKNPAKEAVAGVTAYISMLPMLAICLIVVVIIAAIMQVAAGPIDEFAPKGGAGHPIADEALGENPWASIAKILLLTVVVAPIVEETMFRGVLYRHLRDVTSRMSHGVSVFMAVFVNSLIFAAIHPQGILTVPLLMPLAIGFSLVRQWRGSLIAPMLMHAVHNSIATFGLVLVTL